MKFFSGGSFEPIRDSNLKYSKSDKNLLYYIDYY